MRPILDKYGRTFKTLRVSLLSTCNLGCVYCVGEDEGPGVPRVKRAAGKSVEQGVAGKAQVAGRPLSVPELLRTIERLHGQLQLRTIRLTGGEPLLYGGLVEVIRGLSSMGIPEIKLTTNGSLLKRLAVPMKEAGMVSINVSLDAIEEEVFFRMSKRRSVQRVIDGIDAAMDAGLDVKINTVIMKGMNDGQILPLLEFAFSRGLRIRFLEVMGMGYLHDRSQEYLFTREEILLLIAGHYRYTPLGRAGSATASYWQTDSGQVFGVIANESEPFCGDCDRLRLDSEGNIYGCLSSNHPIALDGDEEEEWNEKLQMALLQKQALRFTGSDLSMLHIGG
jgi:cyclic pyranopterin phosphate synthase